MSAAVDALLSRVGRWRFEGGLATSLPTSAGSVLTVRHRRFTLVARAQRGDGRVVHFEGAPRCAAAVLEGLAAALAADPRPD